MNVVDISNRESERMMIEIYRRISDGYDLWSWWNDPIHPEDKVWTFGFLTLVKRHK